MRACGTDIALLLDWLVLMVFELYSALRKQRLSPMHWHFWSIHILYSYLHGIDIVGTKLGKSGSTN